jgi:vacuolar protein sorting-associated protein 41
VLSLVEFDQELMEKRKQHAALLSHPANKAVEENHAISLLVDHIHSIPVSLSLHLIVLSFIALSIDRQSGTAIAKSLVLHISLFGRSVLQRPAISFGFCRPSGLHKFTPHENLIQAGFLQVKLYAQFALPRLMDFLRASNYYNLEAVG